MIMPIQQLAATNGPVVVVDDGNNNNNNSTTISDLVSSIDHPPIVQTPQPIDELFDAGLVPYLFAELYNKNLSLGRDTNSPAQVVPVAIHPSSNEPVQFSSGASSTGAPAGQVASTGSVGGTGLSFLGGATSPSSIVSSTAANGSASGMILPIQTTATTGRPYFGDVFYSFHGVYWPIHCVICLVICTLGIFANVTNIIVLTRPNMITAVNTILSAMAFSDLIVNVSNIPYLIHEFSDSSNYTTFYGFPWAAFILFHAHATVTAHTISIWLTCVLATWRYLVVCRSQASNQRNFSVGLAKRAIVGVFLFVPIFCIPNYISFAIVREVTYSNDTIYKVGFSHLANESNWIKTFNFWIFSCLNKLVPCVLLTFFTTVLIRKLLNARERRLRLATYGGAGAGGGQQDICHKGQMISGPGRGAGSHQEFSKLFVPNGDTNRDGLDPTTLCSKGIGVGPPLINGSGVKSNSPNQFGTTDDQQTAAAGEQQQPTKQTNCNRFESIIDQASSGDRIDLEEYNGGVSSSTNRAAVASNRLQLAPQSGSSCGCNTEADILATSCTSSAGSEVAGNGFTGNDESDSSQPFSADLFTGCNYHNNGTKHHHHHTKIMSQLIVESTTHTGNNGQTTATISLTTAPTKMLASCDTKKSITSGQGQGQQISDDRNQLYTIVDSSKFQVVTGGNQQRSASGCDAHRPTGNTIADTCPDRRKSSNHASSANNINNDPLMNNDNQHLIQRDHPDASQQDPKGTSASHADLSLALGSSDNVLTRSPTGATMRAKNRCSLAATPTSTNLDVVNDRLNEKRASETNLGTNNVRGRSMGSTTLAPFQLVKLQAAQRQLNQNETTTRLLIAVMIVFLICEFPAGILAALCAILGQEFFENVYQPTGTLTDLLALINSSVNFILYCFMSTQFRITFYRVVLHCPAPNLSTTSNNDQYEANKESRKQSARKNASHHP